MSEFHPVLLNELLQRARELRKESTFPERRLWACLRGRRLAGLKFRGQHAVGPFIVDFYCHEHRLGIELDGARHEGQGEYDLARERSLQSQGLRVIRFHNDDVLRDVEPLLACGIDLDRASSPAFPHPNPLPEGEGTEEGT